MYEFTANTVDELVLVSLQFRQVAQPSSIRDVMGV